MRRWGWIVAGTVVFALVASQILVPSVGEQRIENRLTARGGTADVTLGAFPAARLLFGNGERFEVSARDLDLALDQGDPVFSRLNGFSIVNVSIDSSKAGPLEISHFELTRDGGGPYHLVSSGETTPQRLVDYGFDSVDIPGSDLFSVLLGDLVSSSDSPVPVDLDMQLTSDDDGRVRVVSGGGSIAGVSSGQLAEMLTSAIVVKL